MQLNLAYPEVEFNGLSNVWIVTEEEDLLSRLQVYLEKFPLINIHPLIQTLLLERYDELADSNHNLIVIDTALPEVKLTELLHTIRKSLPVIKIILLQDQTSPDLINKIIEFRISGLLQIESDGELFLKAFRAVQKGEYWFPHEIINRILTFFNNQRDRFAILPSTDFVFTRCEQKVIDSLVKGLPNKHIAQQLAVSPETVKKHMKNIFAKTGARNRSELILFLCFRIR